MIKEYYLMTKPGIIRGNVITALGAFLFASKGHVDILLMISTVLGVSLIIASACVFNNYLDRDIDRAMDRTKNRALASAKISHKNALFFGAVLGLSGVFISIYFVNLITTLLGILAFLVYVVVYGYAKRKSEHGTLVGSIAGALPITAGYVAVTGRVDEVAMTLFLILVLWQMPHFYSIAIFRINDYKSAKLPMLPIVRGILNTKIQMVAYMMLFFISVISLYIQNQTGITYLIFMSIITAFWFYKLLKGFVVFGQRANIEWAVSMFKTSLNVLLAFSILIALNNFLP